MGQAPCSPSGGACAHPTRTCSDAAGHVVNISFNLHPRHVCLKDSAENRRLLPAFPATVPCQSPEGVTEAVFAGTPHFFPGNIDALNDGLLAP